MKFLQIKETCIYIADLEKARDFYSRVLELPVIAYAENKHLFLQVGNSVLLLFNPEDSKNKKSPPGHYGGGKQHFALEIPSENYDDVKNHLTQKGIKIIDEVTWPPGGRSFYFNDPEDNVLEIVCEDGVWV